jgi:hypothetical protein
LLCPSCDTQKSASQKRAGGQLRRLLWGFYLIGWCEVNEPAGDCLERRMNGCRKKSMAAPMKSQPEMITCSVHSCGHLTEFQWLVANNPKEQLWFMCEDCSQQTGAGFAKIALLLSRSRSERKCRLRIGFIEPHEAWKN